MAKSTDSLRTLVAGADLVVRVRVVEHDTFVMQRAEGEKRRAVVRVRVLEVLKGPGTIGAELPLSQHGHGVAQYSPGDEALVFLRPLSKSRELHELGSSGELEWYSTQEHDDAYVLSSKSRRSTIQAARRYVAIEAMPREKRVEPMRRVTMMLLTSGDQRLAVSALRDLTRAPKAPLLTEQDVPKLLRVVHDAKISIGVRVGLLAEIQRRRLVDGDAHWLRLLGATKGADRRVAIQAAGAHPSPRVNAALIEILQGEDGAAAASAAVALGSPGNATAVPPLAKAVASEDTRLATAAIRGLGRVGTTKAREVLSSAAHSHSAPSVRRRATAELRRLDGR
jgi:hypothetical protein